MYNINFEVKYHDIEEELIHKFKQKTQEDYNINPDEEYEYSNQDIIDICDKLYRDELLSVFNAESIIDKAIDDGLEYVKTILFTNVEIKNKINEFIEGFLNEYNNTDSRQDVTDKQQFIEASTFISLFSQPIFYVTHQCICQQYKNETIDPNLLNKLFEFLNHS